jgi:hypothetical protein
VGNVEAIGGNSCGDTCAMRAEPLVELALVLNANFTSRFLVLLNAAFLALRTREPGRSGDLPPVVLVHNESLRGGALLPNPGPRWSGVFRLFQVGGLVSPTDFTRMTADLLPTALWGRSSV